MTKESAEKTGYVYAYRSAWTHPAFNNLREAAIWNFLYQNAFYEDGERNFNGYTFQLKRGQIVVSIKFLAQGFCMTEKGVRVVIQKLEKLGMVVTQGASKGTIITICNYNEYQRKEKTKGEHKGKRGANEGRSKGENNNEANEANEDLHGFDVFWQVYPKRKGSNPKKPAKEKFTKLVKSGISADEITKGAREYAQQQQSLGNVDTPYIAQATTWLNQERWKDQCAQENVVRIVQSPPPIYRD